MIDQFLYPSALWGLMGLMLPLIIHFLSKKKRTEILFGSIQFLEDMPSNRAKAIQFSDFFLFCIRCVLFTTLCFLGAKYLNEKTDKTKKYLIQDKILNNEKYDNIVAEIIGKNEYSSFTLDSGRIQSMWTLIHSANNQEDSTGIIFINQFDQFKGSPVTLQSHVELIELPNMLDDALSKGTIKKSMQKVEWSLQDKPYDRFTYRLSEQNGDGQESRKLRFYASPDLDNTRIIKLIDEVIRRLPYPITWTEDINQAEWAVVTMSDTIDQNICLIRYQNDQNELSLQSLSDKEYLLSGDVKRDNVLKSNLPVLMSEIFNLSYIGIKTYDNRVFDLGQIKKEVQSSTPISNQPISPLWWLILLPIFMIERFIAHKTLIS